LEIEAIDGEPAEGLEIEGASFDRSREFGSAAFDEEAESRARYRPAEAPSSLEPALEDELRRVATVITD
jgi:hypothetical protein